MRALSAFDNGDYAGALPLLIRLADSVKDQRDRVGSIQEKIRVCQRKLAESAGATAQAPAPPPADQSSPAMSAETRKLHQRPKDGQILEIGIKDLGNFDYDIEKGGNLPQDREGPCRVKIRTHGYMIPLDQADNITQFALVPSLFSCCYGQPPGVQHTLMVKTPKGKALGYYPDEIVVEGTLKVDEKKEDGMVVSLFEIDCQSVKPAPK